MANQEKSILLMQEESDGRRIVIFSGSAPRSLEGKLFILETQTDASLEGISYILGQTDDQGRKYVISYGGRSLRPCEKEMVHKRS